MRLLPHPARCVPAMMMLMALPSLLVGAVDPIGPAPAPPKPPGAEYKPAMISKEVTGPNSQIPGTLTYTAGLTSYTGSLTLTVGQTVVIPLDGNGTTAEITASIGPMGNIIYRGSINHTDASGNVVDGFMSSMQSGKTPSYTLKKDDLSVTFNATTEPKPALTLVPFPPGGRSGFSRANAIAVNKQKTARGEDTATARLQIIATDLDKALTALQQLPPEPRGHFAPAMADITKAQTEITHGLEYLKTHPEENSLAARTREVAMSTLGSLWNPSGYASVRDYVEANGLTTAEESVRDAFGQIGDPANNRPLLGEMGGNRDAIMRRLLVANVEMTANYQEFLRAATGSTAGSAANTDTVVTAAALASGVDDAAHTGSIRGSVQPMEGAATVYAMILLSQVESLTAQWNGRGVGRANLPVTFADENGNFVIKNLPPGFYGISTTSSFDNHVIVEVKEGAETKLPGPMKYNQRQNVGGGAGEG